MNTKHSPGKITLGMMKGKPITTSVPVIHYHASDDELEELYPSTDDDKEITPESERQSPKVSLSPSKSHERRTGNEETSECSLEKRSASVDGTLSEGTPPTSDPWKVLSEIKGKITKTFEDKLSEIKNERKKKRHRSRENSSISDSEDFVDITPTEENISEKQDKESSALSGYPKESSTRFGFSHIKTGLKTKNSEEDSVESGIEAAEFAETVPTHTDFELNSTTENFRDASDDDNLLYQDVTRNTVETMILSKQPKSDNMLLQLQRHILHQLIYQLVPLLITICISYYFIPLPEYLLGLVAGMLITVSFFSILDKFEKFLTSPPEDEICARPVVPVLEIQAAEEHAVVERFEGWLNELPYSYDPENYHVARTKSVFFRLEENMLRIMETRMRIPKRAVWDEPKHKLRFTRKRVYNLTDANVELLPEGLIRRRRWSKKYPICITLEKSALIENVALKDNSNKEAVSSSDDINKIIIEEEGKNEKEALEEQDHLQEEEEDDEEEEDEETDEDFIQPKDSKDIFDDYQDDEGRGTMLRIFVFARADRQKEDWYRRLHCAASRVKKGNLVSLTSDSPISLNSLLIQQTLNDSKGPSVSEHGISIPNELSYTAYMTRYIDGQLAPVSECDQALTTDNTHWFNCLIGRVLFDMHNCPDTINLIQDKIQRKLSNIKLPYFMESLLVSEVAIGQGAPIIHQITKPTLDERGLWLDMNITYKGCLTMTIETKLNLMKLKRAASVPSNPSDTVSIDETKPARSPMFDSDVEDSPETSTEDEDTASAAICNTSKELTPPQSSGRKFLSMVDKIAANKYFQHATELSYVRRAMEGVSNTEIRLMVSVSSIEGCLSVNIPPAPSDRLWYGFKPVPKVSLTVQPAVGERTVNIVYVTKWIETKLLREFEKVVVLPNMDDLIIPLCPNYPYVAT